jgi:hypothetical protein
MINLSNAGLARLTQSLRSAVPSGTAARRQQQRWHSGHKSWREIEDKTDFMSYCECQKAAIVLASWAVLGFGLRAWLRRGHSSPSSTETPSAPAADERAAL